MIKTIVAWLDCMITVAAVPTSVKTKSPRYPVKANRVRSIVSRNVSNGLSTVQMASEASSAVALLMNNPYEEVTVESMEFDIRILPKDITSHIWSANVSDTNVRAGDKVGIDVVIESVLTPKNRIYVWSWWPLIRKEMTLCVMRMAVNW